MVIWYWNILIITALELVFPPLATIFGSLYVTLCMGLAVRFIWIDFAKKKQRALSNKVK